MSRFSATIPIVTSDGQVLPVVVSAETPADLTVAIQTLAKSGAQLSGGATPPEEQQKTKTLADRAVIATLIRSLLERVAGEEQSGWIKADKPDRIYNKPLPVLPPPPTDAVTITDPAAVVNYLTQPITFVRFPRQKAPQSYRVDAVEFAFYRRLLALLFPELAQILGTSARPWYVSAAQKAREQAAQGQDEADGQNKPTPLPRR